MNQHLKIWEISLLFALCFTLCTGLIARAQQQKLSHELVRLHIVANSDSARDQALKLKVRDTVLKQLEPSLSGADDTASARKIIASSLEDIRKAACAVMLENGKAPKASASLTTESFLTREYDSFSLPAGDYLSLRIVLGDGKGHNWWCVVFPPLCMTATETDAFQQLSSGSQSMISDQSGQYKLKFHILELFQQIRRRLA